jgi:AP-2 complex subunit alpha
VMHLDADKEMMSQCVALLGKFVAVREPNIRYLGLENMTRMLLVADVNESIKKHQAHIISSLKDPDIRYISLGPANKVFERTEEGMRESWNW